MERWGIFSSDGELLEWYPSKEEAEERQKEFTVVFGLYPDSRVRNLEEAEG